MHRDANSSKGQECRDCDNGYLQPFLGQTVCLQCPESGVECENKNVINVSVGYYMQPPEEAEALAKVEVWRCAQEGSCSGGPAVVNGSAHTECASGRRGDGCAATIIAGPGHAPMEGWQVWYGWLRPKSWYDRLP